jgi:hypothetical protein
VASAPEDDAKLFPLPKANAAIAEKRTSSRDTLAANIAPHSLRARCPLTAELICVCVIGDTDQLA